eukprot:4092181-Pleurochrysis_carterae.AAC.1
MAGRHRRGSITARPSPPPPPPPSRCRHCQQRTPSPDCHEGSSYVEAAFRAPTAVRCLQRHRGTHCLQRHRTMRLCSQQNNRGHGSCSKPVILERRARSVTAR